MSVNSSDRPEIAATEQSAEVFQFPADHMPQPPVDEPPAPETSGQYVWRRGKQVMVGAGMVAVALTGAELILECGPGTHISAAGFETNTHLRFGHNYSEVDFGSPGRAVGRPHLHFLGLNFGLKVDTDGSNFDLSNGDTRAQVTQILSHPDPEIAKAVTEYKKSLPEHGGAGFGIVLAAELYAYRRWRTKRRNSEGADNLTEAQRGDYKADHRQFVGAAAAILSGCALYNAQLYALPNNPTIVGDPSLIGSAAEGWMLQGSTPELVQVFTGDESTEKFDEETESNLKALLAKRPDFMSKPGWTTIVRSDDIQDVVGMARQEGVLSKEIGADEQIISDTADEKGNSSLIFDTLRYESGYKPTILVKGNHDNDETDQNAKLSGVDVGDYSVHSVNGIPILFLPSIDVAVAKATAIGSILRDPELDSTAAVQKAADLICQYHVQQVYVHDLIEGNAIGNKVAELAQDAAAQAKNAQIQGRDAEAQAKEAEVQGCDSLLYIGDGRTFVKVDTRHIEVENTNHTIVEEPLLSSGGHDTTAVSTGPISISAPLEIIRENNTTHEVQTVTIWFHPDGTVTAPKHMKTIVQPDVSPENQADGSSRRHIEALDLDKNKVYVKKQQ